MTEPYRFALIGEAIEYSLSPRVFKAIFEQAGRQGAFEVHSVSRDKLGRLVKQLVTEGVQGFSITIPHKQTVIDFLEHVDPSAIAVEAVNSVMVENGRLTGFNTDIFGFSFALKRARFGGTERPALIIGSGGSARAVIHALHHDFSINHFVVWGRSEANLRQIKQHFSGTAQDVQIQTLAGIDSLLRVEPAPAIIVNCSPLGGANLIDSIPLPQAFDWSGVDFYFDLNYNEENQAVSRARSHGVMVADGSAMLVAQAVRSFELWTGQKVDFEPVYKEVFPGPG